MSKRQQQRFDWLEGKGYLFDAVSRVPYGRGALLLAGRGKWVERLELMLNADGSFYKARFG